MKRVALQVVGRKGRCLAPEILFKFWIILTLLEIRQSLPQAFENLVLDQRECGPWPIAEPLSL
jgi:hypothetical protein